MTNLQHLTMKVHLIEGEQYAYMVEGHRVSRIWNDWFCDGAFCKGKASELSTYGASCSHVKAVLNHVHYEFVTCLVCGRKQTAPSYSEWSCSRCKQHYVYDEGFQIELTEEQIEALRKLGAIPNDTTTLPVDHDDEGE